MRWGMGLPAAKPKARLVSPILPDPPSSLRNPPRQWVPDLGRENQVMGLGVLWWAGSLLHCLQQPGSTQSDGGQGYKAQCASSCSPMHLLLMHVLLQPDASPPIYILLQPEACPPDACPPCSPIPVPLQPSTPAAPRRAGVPRQPVSTARLPAPCAARYIAEPVKIISACACVVCSNAPA